MNQFGRLIGIVPLGIGITLLVFLWSQPFGGFHSPPLFFRVFGSFIALFFVLIGSGIVFGNITDPGRLKAQLEQLQELQKNSQKKTSAKEQSEQQASAELNYTCSTCGATLSDGANVSPHGDVKCEHCGKWFNVHQES